MISINDLKYGVLLIATVLIIACFEPGAAVLGAVHEAYKGSNFNMVMEAAKQGFTGKEAISVRDVINIGAQRGAPFLVDLQKMFSKDATVNQKKQVSTSKAASTKNRPPLHNRDALTSIRIEGTKEFNQAITNALKTLEAKAPSHYDRISRYVESIEYTPKANMGEIIAYVNPEKASGRIFFVKLPYKESDDYEYISTLVHESRHIEQYYASPEMFRDTSLVEHDAVRVSVEALKQVGAPKRVIDLCIDSLKTKWWENNYDYTPPPK